MTLEDIQEVLRDECGITMKREDAQHREWMWEAFFGGKDNLYTDKIR